jgi:hypothetical protein
MNTSYDEIVESTPQDLHPEIFTESYYNIPLDPTQLVKVLEILRNQNEVELYTHITTFIQEEYD